MPAPRLVYLATLGLAVALGLGSRLHPVGWWPWDKSLGDALYAVAAFLGLSLLWPRMSLGWRAALALAWCLAVEAFQATGWPAQQAHLLAVRWLIGTTFAWHDLACYLIGVAFAAAAEGRFRNRTTPGPEPRPSPPATREVE